MKALQKGLDQLSEEGASQVFRPLQSNDIIVGAVGNLVDYVAYGFVVDMFHFILWGYDYPVFNVADTAITVGMGWLIVLSFFLKDPKAQTK